MRILLALLMLAAAARAAIPPTEAEFQAFAAAYQARTGSMWVAARTAELDRRLAGAGLSLAQQVALVRIVSPRARDAYWGSMTGDRDELRLQRLWLSVPPRDLAELAYQLEYDGDYKDLEEYLFTDIDDETYRGAILKHLKTAPEAGVKVLTDVDDTMFPNLIDRRYPQGKVPYPGVMALYEALQSEPAHTDAIHVTALSARPDPMAGVLEEASIASLKAIGARAPKTFKPSVLSGALYSSVRGTLQTWTRANVELLTYRVGDDHEVAIGDVKFENFKRFARAYPRYTHVFLGDAGQADAITARRMVTEQYEGADRVLTTFVHDLRFDGDGGRVASRSFASLPEAVKVTETTPHARGVIVYRNTIEAARIAHRHAGPLRDLVTADELLRVTLAALKEFGEIDFKDTRLRDMLRAQYREDAARAADLLGAKGAPIHAALAGTFWRRP
jgi:hypothetical protein